MQAMEGHMLVTDIWVMRLIDNYKPRLLTLIAAKFAEARTLTGNISNVRRRGSEVHETMRPPGTEGAAPSFAAGPDWLALPDLVGNLRPSKIKNYEGQPLGGWANQMSLNQ